MSDLFGSCGWPLRRRHSLKNTNNYGYLFILPFFIIFSLFSLYPILNTFLVSLTNEDMTRFEINFVGFRNYIQELTTPLFWKSFFNTWIIWLPNITIQLILALFLAVLLTNRRMNLKFTGGFRAIYFFPSLVTYASVAILAFTFTDWQNGILNQLIFGTGEAAKENYIFWLNDPNTARFIISVIQTWLWFGNSMILFIAGIISIPESYFEAATVDGANLWTVFRRITFPLLKPVMIYIGITSLIGGMNMFDIPWIMTRGSGGPEQSMMTTVMYMYNRAFSWSALGSGSSVAFLLFILTAIFSIFYLKIIARNSETA